MEEGWAADKESDLEPHIASYPRSMLAPYLPLSGVVGMSCHCDALSIGVTKAEMQLLPVAPYAGDGSEDACAVRAIKFSLQASKCDLHGLWLNMPISIFFLVSSGLASQGVQTSTHVSPYAPPSTRVSPYAPPSTHVSPYAPPSTRVSPYAPQLHPAV